MLLFEDHIVIVCVDIDLTNPTTLLFLKKYNRKIFSPFFSHKLQVQLNDHVVAKGDRTGHIRYIGHLDKQTQPNLLFTGLELDSPGQSTLKLPHTKKQCIL